MHGFVYIFDMFISYLVIVHPVNEVMETLTSFDFYILKVFHI